MQITAAEIGLNDVGVFANLFGRSFSEQPTVVLDRNPLAGRHHNIHVMFHLNYCDALGTDPLNKSHEIRGFGHVETGGGFVEE